MASGLAVIATTVGGIPSLIQSEKQGFLINAGSVDELAQSMRILINDRGLVEQMGRINVKIKSSSVKDMTSILYGQLWPI